MKLSKLNTIIKIRKNAENIEAQKLYEIKKELFNLENQKNEKKKILNLILSEIKNERDPFIMKNSILFIEKIKDDVKNIEIKIIEKQKEFEIQREELLKAMKERKKIEEYKKILKEKIDFEAQKKENSILQELVTISYSRRINGN